MGMVRPKTDHLGFFELRAWQHAAKAISESWVWEGLHSILVFKHCINLSPHHQCHGHRIFGTQLRILNPASAAQIPSES